MRAMYFHAQGHRWQITREDTEVMGKMIWVMERAKRYSTGPGTHPARHCWAAPHTVDGLAGLLLIAATTRIW